MNSCFPQFTALSIKDADKADEKNGKTKSFYCGSPNVSSQKSQSSKGRGRFSFGSNSSSAAGAVLPSTNGDLKSAVGKFEVLQDLDLYYIKQIAHNLKEFDLEQKIEVEIKMREGSTRLLAACKHQTQVLEAAKNLLISNERMTAYMTELQKRKRECSKICPQQATRGKVSLSDLRIPLIWKDIDHFKNKGDYRRFAVFCLVRIGTEIYDTSLLFPVDRSLTDLTFPDSLVFNKVCPEFKMKLEVYSHMLQDDLSIASAPRRIKNTIHTSISRTVGKKLAASLRDELNSEKIGPNFELVASAELTLDDTNDNIRTHDLKIENSGNGKHQLPLFGHFCGRLAAQPNCMLHEIYSNYVYIPESFFKGDGAVKDRRNWIKCRAQLIGFKLKFWTAYDERTENKEPDACVDINRKLIVNLKKNSPVDIEICPEPNGNCLIIRCESSDERAKWHKHLVQHILDSERWKQAADTFMTIQMNEPYRLSYVTSRHGSLYEQTAIIDTFGTKDSSDYKFEMPMTRSANRSSVSSCNPSLLKEQCSSSSSTTTSTKPPRSGRLSSWRFSKNN